MKPTSLLLALLLCGCSTPPTTIWLGDKARADAAKSPITLAPAFTIEGRKVDFGLRADGTVVWRDAAP